MEIELALAHNEELQQAQDSVEKSAQNQKEAERLSRRSEQEVQAQRLKIEQVETTLYSGKVTNPKELQDLQNESISLKKYLTVLEDRQLEAMIALEEADERFQEDLAYLENVQDRFSEHHAMLIEERTSLLKFIERQEDERVAAANAIPEKDLQLYEQLRIQRGGVAVARVTDKACSACGTTLNAALLQAARSPSQITRCSTCNRILYSV